MDEHILAATAIGLDETVTLRCVKPLTVPLATNLALGTRCTLRYWSGITAPFLAATGDRERRALA